MPERKISRVGGRCCMDCIPNQVRGNLKEVDQSATHVDIAPKSEESRSTTAPQRNNNPPAMTTEIAMMKIAPRI